MESTNSTEEYINRTLASFIVQQPPHFYRFYMIMRDLTGLVLFPLICFLGLPANIFGIIVLSMKQMRTSTSVFLIALAVTDLIKIVDDILYFVSVLINDISPEVGPKLYAYLYPYTHYVFNATMMAAAWITVAIAIERYVAVCHAYKAKLLCTITHSVIISGCIIVSSFIFSIPYALRYTMSHHQNNTETDSTVSLAVSTLWMRNDFGLMFNWVHYAVRSVIPIILLILFSCFILYGLRQCQFGHRKRRISLCLLAVIVAFITCVCPDTIMSTIFRTGYYEESYFARAIREITDFLVLSNTIINFIIYCVFNPQFLKTLKGLLSCCICLRVRRTSDEGETLELSTGKPRRQTLDLLMP